MEGSKRKTNGVKIEKKRKKQKAADTDSDMLLLFLFPGKQKQRKKKKRVEANKSSMLQPTVYLLNRASHSSVQMSRKKAMQFKKKINKHSTPEDGQTP